MSMRSSTERARSPSRDARPGSSARNLAIISEVARHGLLTSEQIGRIDGGSKQVCTRILQHLVEDKLLRRLDRAPQPFIGSFFDARPRVYAVTAKGLRALDAAGMSLNVAPKRNAVLLAHEIELANFCLSMRGAVAAAGFGLIDEPELKDMMPLSTLQLDKPLRLHATAHPHNFPHLDDVLKETIEIVTEPDRLLVITRPDGSGWSLAAEIDLGNEDLTAKILRGKATWARKVIGYHSAWLHGTHIAQWGEWCRSFRVLTVTTSEKRMQNMIDIQQHITRGVAGLFAYSTPERIAAHGVIGPAWANAKRENFSLIEA